MNAVLQHMSAVGRTRPVVGVAALVALATLGAFGIAFAPSPAPGGAATIPVKNVATSTESSTTTTSGSPSTSGTTTTTSNTSTATSATTSTDTSTPTTTPVSSALDDLYRVLPPGYTATQCHPSDTPSPQALATVDCGAPDQASGPTSARFLLFADANSLANNFQVGVNEQAISECPGGIESPRAWQDPATPSFAAGSLACGTKDNVPELTWTKNDVLLLGSVQGPELAGLYGWWLSLG